MKDGIKVNGLGMFYLSGFIHFDGIGEPWAVDHCQIELKYCYINKTLHAEIYRSCCLDSSVLIWVIS